ncbi:hypothetical protein [Sphingobium sp. DC-2]|uniref:hypothetical protein n=1 Tax=Sphingobium sp. DC-2 TaxID=1303256 RepID=UPI0004C46915|nr:hypothetical protein [Sphingobium sp. DC-2]
MRPTEPLPLNHSWPLFDLHAHLAPLTSDRRLLRDEHALADMGIGQWHCDLAGDRLNWTSGVYDLFGLDRNMRVPRPLAVSLYVPDSREAMEQLRAYAIRYRRGFTLDVDVRPLGSGGRTMRLVAAPILQNDQVVALHGMKRLLPRGAGISPRQEPALLPPP